MLKFFLLATSLFGVTILAWDVTYYTDPQCRGEEIAFNKYEQTGTSGGLCINVGYNNVGSAIVSNKLDGQNIIIFQQGTDCAGEILGSAVSSDDKCIPFSLNGFGSVLLK